MAYFQTSATSFADWLATSLGQSWVVTPTRIAGLEDLARVIPRAPSGRPELRHLLLPVAEWTALLNTGFQGTDVGVLPSHASRDLGITSVRAVAAKRRKDSFPATILEVYEPSATDVLRTQRVVYAADDGGRWAFGQFGDPYPFEDLAAYEQRRIKDRFTPAMLADYLSQLGVPVDTQPDLSAALVVERAPFVGRA